MNTHNTLKVAASAAVDVRVVAAFLFAVISPRSFLIS